MVLEAEETKSERTYLMKLFLLCYNMGQGTLHGGGAKLFLYQEPVPAIHSIHPCAKSTNPFVRTELSGINHLLETYQQVLNTCFLGDTATPQQRFRLFW